MNSALTYVLALVRISIYCRQKRSGALYEIFCILTVFISLSPFACAQTLDVHILGTPLTQGGMTLPSGSEITTDTTGRVVAARLAATLQWGTTSVPANTLIVFRDATPEAAFLPKDENATIDGAIIQGGVATLPSAATVQPIDWQHECLDPRPWLSGQMAGSILAGNPPPGPPKTIQTSALPGNPTSAGSTTFTLPNDYTSSNFALPKGATVATSSDGSSVVAAYLPQMGHVAGVTVPPGTYVKFAGGEILLEAPFPIAVANYEAKPDTLLSIDSRYGTINTVTIAADAALTYNIQAPGGSRISYLAGQLFVIKLSRPTSVRGFPVDKDRLVCFAPDGVANLPLAKDTTWKSLNFHSGYFLLVTQQGAVASAAINQPITIGPVIYYKPSSWNATYYGMTFWPSGSVRDGVLAQPATISGIRFAADQIQYDEAGVVQLGILAADASINGIPCQGGKQVRFNHAGKPVSFTLSGPWSIGASTFTAGQTFNGVFSLKDTITLMDPPTLADSIHELQINYLGEIAKSILESSSKFPFGNMGTPNIHDVSANFPAADYILTHQEVAIPNLFTNPPFADCDGNVTADATFRWSITHDKSGTHVNLWISQLGGNISHNFCPGTSFLEGAGKVWGWVRGEDYSIGGRASVLAAKFVSRAQVSAELQSKMIAKVTPLLPTGGQNAVVDPDSLKFDRVYIGGGNLLVDFSYQATLQ